MCVWNLSLPLGRAAASDTALGHGVQISFLGITGVLRSDSYLQEGFVMPALLQAGERAVNILCLNCSSQYVKWALAGGLMSFSCESRKKKKI